MTQVMREDSKRIKYGNLSPIMGGTGPGSALGLATQALDESPLNAINFSNTHTSCPNDPEEWHKTLQVHDKMTWTLNGCPLVSVHHTIDMGKQVS